MDILYTRQLPVQKLDTKYRTLPQNYVPIFSRPLLELRTVFLVKHQPGEPADMSTLRSVWEGASVCVCEGVKVCGCVCVCVCVCVCEPTYVELRYSYISLTAQAPARA